MKSALSYSLNIAFPVSLNRAGKFEALQDDWQHSASRLEDFELIVVTEGDLYLQYLDVKYSVHPGEFLLLAPLSPSASHSCLEQLRHGFKKSKCSFYWMHFYCSSYSPRDTISYDHMNEGRSNILIPVHGRLSSPARVLRMMVQLQDCILMHYENYYCDLLATLILSEIFNQQTLLRNHVQPQDFRTNQLFYDISSTIEHEIDTPLKVSELAARFGYNEKYLSRLFKKHTGVGLKKYILEKKLERADFLLIDSNIPVSDIAFRLGFSSYHSFERAYVASRGTVPTSYRQLYARKSINHS